MVLAFVPWRGVAEMAESSYRFVRRFVSAVRGAERFGWFFHMELLGGLFVRAGSGLFAAGRA